MVGVYRGHERAEWGQGQAVGQLYIVNVLRGLSMSMSSYRHRPDYTTETKYHDGSREVFRHCGRCLSIIPGRTCQHCTVKEEKADERLKMFIAKKKGGAI